MQQLKYMLREYYFKLLSNPESASERTKTIAAAINALSMSGLVKDVESSVPETSSSSQTIVENAQTSIGNQIGESVPKKSSNDSDNSQAPLMKGKEKVSNEITKANSPIEFTLIDCFLLFLADFFFLIYVSMFSKLIENLIKYIHGQFVLGFVIVFYFLLSL